MAQLAIKGHATRGKEVIQLLEMLGGKNLYNYAADCDSLCFYIAKGTNIIYYDWVNSCFEDVIIFTLEELEKKYPYRIGDKVKVITKSNNVYKIIEMMWDNKEIVYALAYSEGIICWFNTAELRPHKEEDIEKLFDVINENGYKWNYETKTLEKVFELKFQVGDRVQNKNTNMIGTINLIINDERKYQVDLENGGITYILFEFQDSWELVPKFKVGDKIVDKSGLCTYIIKSVSDEYYGLELHHGIGVMPVKHQNDWELVKDNINPKFKVGDIIKDKSNIKWKITDASRCFYELTHILTGLSKLLEVKAQNDYELVPNKFDISTLKPLESRVLMRSSNAREWVGTIYSHYSNNKFYGCGMCCDQCIPYEGNENLLGTTNDCNDFYKNW